jgi:hypothetical protein
VTFRLQLGQNAGSYLLQFLTGLIAQERAAFVHGWGIGPQLARVPVCEVDEARGGLGTCVMLDNLSAPLFNDVAHPFQVTAPQNLPLFS